LREFLWISERENKVRYTGTRLGEAVEADDAAVGVHGQVAGA
jgi:hypothetical protein